MPRKPTKKQLVLDVASARGWARIGEAEWAELRRQLPDISESVIRQSGLEIDPPWCGVRQHTFEELDMSLRDFSKIYTSRPDLRPICRVEVIAAKDRAKWIAARESSDPELRARKATMAERMLIWLGDPSIYPTWSDALHRRETES